MIRFNNDYSATGHKAILDYISNRLTEQNSGYGTDPYCELAAEMIRNKCCCERAAVHFLVGGTQANLVLISAALRSHQAVLAAKSAHINVHETGSIEAVGHKVLPIESSDGKISAHQVRTEVMLHRTSPDAEHIAQPKMVYISNPTEYGTLYSLDQLRELSAVCRELGLFLYVDGARLGYGLTARGNDIQLLDLAALCDAFYIGGTKVGALFGEAMVICNPLLAEDFRYIMKQRGGMLAKGWLLGMQFCALFENDLYYSISTKANEYADQIRSCLLDLGYKLFLPGTTNQVFAVLPDSVLYNLGKNFSYSFWERFDKNSSVVRFCTSWATHETDVRALCDELIRLTSEERKLVDYGRQ